MAPSRVHDDEVLTVTSNETGARHAHAKLLQWLQAEAYPRWSQFGVDRESGGYYESLTAEGANSELPRRARVQARQIFVFARAPALGWNGEAARLVERGLAYFLRHYRRADGLFRTLVAPDGRPADERAYLYDQAFVLLALAECQRLLGPRSDVLAEAHALRVALLTHLRRTDRGFASGVPEAVPLLSNPHMHLLEALQAWMAISEEPAWGTLAEEIVGLALDRLIDPSSGALYEQFDGHWRVLGDSAARVVEPGHQFEWAWLLLRWGGADSARARSAAARLADLGEARGIRAGAAINSLDGNLAVTDTQARLWPQTERLKAAVRLWSLTGDARRLAVATEAAETLWRYLDLQPRGLWYDRLTPEGKFLPEPAPASSFYHIVGAIAEFGSALGVTPAM